jgi:DNA/RNA-binding domain of Phe-tRNA-synthetase-like protein
VSEPTLTVAPDVAAIVRPAWLVAGPVVVREAEPRLDEPLAAAAARMRTAADRQAVVTAVRTMYKRVGLDPTKTRPSSEALLRRVRRGQPLPRINSLVDLVNWTSLETQLPFGLYDLDRTSGPIALRLGAPGEEYAGIRKDVVHLEGRLTLADGRGPFGNPTSDSARTMVTPSTTRVLVVVFVPEALSAEAGDHALALTRERIDTFAVDRP